MSQEKWQVLQWAGRIVKYATLSGLSSKFGWGSVDCPAIDPEQGDRPSQQRVRIMQMFGFRSAPKVTGAECIVVAPRGGATNAVAVAVDNLGVGPTDLKEGESAMYSSGGSTIRQSDAGKITIDSSGAQDVQVNGGTLSVARRTDQTSSGSVTFSVIPDPMVMGNVIFQVVCVSESGATQTIGISCPGASASSATTSNPLVFPIIGQISGPCAPRFKG